MDVAQGQIVQAGIPDLGGADGVVGGTHLGGIAVKNGHRVGFRALCPEVFQKSGAVHALKGTAPDPAVQVFDDNGFQTPCENMDIIRPLFLQPGTARGAEIMIARGNKHRNTAAGKSGLDQLHRFPGGCPVKQITGQ